MWKATTSVTSREAQRSYFFLPKTFARWFSYHSTLIIYTSLNSWLSDFAILMFFQADWQFPELISSFGSMEISFHGVELVLILVFYKMSWLTRDRSFTDSYNDDHLWHIILNIFKNGKSLHYISYFDFFHITFIHTHWLNLVENVNEV